MEKEPKCCTQPSADNQQPYAGGGGTSGSSRAQPIPAGADQAAPHRTGRHYSRMHLPAETRTLKEEGDVACQCAWRGAPVSVSEVISNSSGCDVGSAARFCRRCVCALVFRGIPARGPPPLPRCLGKGLKKVCFCWRGKRNIFPQERFLSIMGHVHRARASVRIPGGVAHIEIEVEVNKRE